MQSSEFSIRLMDLPHTVKGFVALDEDGFANIYINSRLSREEQRKAARHEINHLQNNDFYNDADIASVELAHHE